MVVNTGKQDTIVKDVPLLCPIHLDLCGCFFDDVNMSGGKGKSAVYSDTSGSLVARSHSAGSMLRST